MDKETVISVENVSKKYCKSLKRSMYYGAIDIGRNMIGLSSRSERLRKDEFWALNDISFEVKKGETLGIIGPNGSGKTTLLKMLNGIFWPDRGKITVKGRVGALIELGAGFHPLLTGRENVYINAAIFGMKKEEVDKQFDSIVEFAGVGDFIDSPVKYYSSGMFVRLGFAVAVHSYPEILLIDEILAVGDTNFQRKCLDKIKFFRTEGKTIIFVSHNLLTVQSICQSILILEKGKRLLIGIPSEAIPFYENHIINSDHKLLTFDGLNWNRGHSTFYKIRFLDINGREGNLFNTFSDICIEAEGYCENLIKKPSIGLGIFNCSNEALAIERSIYTASDLTPIQGKFRIKLKIGRVNLKRGVYSISLSISDAERHIAMPEVYQKGDTFVVEDHNEILSEGVLSFDVKWQIERIE